MSRRRKRNPGTLTAAEWNAVMNGTASLPEPAPSPPAPREHDPDTKLPRHLR